MARGATYDLIGQKFNKLTVVGKTKDEKGYSVWVCNCDCGGTKNVNTFNLMRGRVVSCGCAHKTSVPVAEPAPVVVVEDAPRRRGRGAIADNLVGNVYGKLTVIEKMPKYGHGQPWKVRCECGNVAHFMGYEVKKLTHCGCEDGKPRNPQKFVYREGHVNRTYKKVKPKIGFDEAMGALSEALIGGKEEEITRKNARITINSQAVPESLAMEVNCATANLETVSKIVYGFLNLVKEAK